MQLTKFETMLLRDAVIEHWHNSIKNSKNEKLKSSYKYLMDDIKRLTQMTTKQKIIINN